jgi:hypothetical protein
MFLIDTQNKKAVSLEKKSFSELKLSERYDLQEWIADNPRILGENLLIIQKEFDGFPDTNERLDLLAHDESGKLVIIENKLDDSGKDVVWQALKYVSYCATLTKSEISEIYQRYLAQGNAQDKISEFYDGQDFESIRLNPVEGDQRIILVAANFRKEVTSTVLWLRNYHGIDITCVKVSPYKDGEKLYLDVEQIIPTQDIGDYQIRLTAKKQEETISSKEEATRHIKRFKFWEKALPVLRVKTGLYNNVSPIKDNWLTGASGYSGIVFNPVIRMDGARAELYIDTGDEKRNTIIYEKLKFKKNDFDSSFSGELIWQDLPGKRACRICVQYHDFGLNNEEHWDEIIDWLSDSIESLLRTFKPLLETIMK